jgi:hypothetical protein
MNEIEKSEPVDERRLVRLWRAKRKKHLRPLAEMPLWQAITHIETRTITGLQAIQAAMDGATSTNCWWAEMEACRHFRPLVQEQLRRKLERKNRKANANCPSVGATDKDHE